MVWRMHIVERRKLRGPSTHFGVAIEHFPGSVEVYDTALGGLRHQTLEEFSAGHAVEAEKPFSRSPR